MFGAIGKFLGLGVKLVPYIGIVINAIEVVAAAIPAFRGPAKRQAVVDTVTKALPILEDALGKDAVNDPKVVEAVGNYIDAYVALQNAIKATREAKGTGEPK